MRVTGTCAGFALLNGTGLKGTGTVAVADVDGVGSADACCALCSSNPECTAWTWHDDSTPTAGERHRCSLLKSKLHPHSSTGAFSGERTQPPTPTPPTPPTPPPTPYPYPPVPLPALGFQPNIVLVLTDDQDAEIGGMDPLPMTRALLGGEGGKGGGATLGSYYINTPVCCPSRSEYFSGRYHHNVRQSSYEGGPGCGDERVNQSHPCGCMRMDDMGDEFEARTYANYLQEAGYATAYYGKFLNPPAMDLYCQDDGRRIPGWDDILAMCKTDYYNVPWAQNGYLNRTGKLPNEYTTAIIGNRSVEFIRARGMDGARQQPFLLVAATRAPHSPQTPAPWYKHNFPNATNPRTPAFNATDLGDHVGFVASQPPITQKETAAFDEEFRNRWRTLQSVDDLVAGIVAELEAQGLLNRTYIFYSSDVS
jgi:N-acetylglucosamine-6-sulfatase